MKSVAQPGLTATERVALYARVSTEDQAERQTIESQLDLLRKLADAHEWAVAGEYIDDGTSGTISLDHRTDGKRLLDDAAAGRLNVVYVYRVDRLGRRLSTLMEAHDALERLGVSIKSATEPFDTTTPFGRAMFQFLGTFAELERSTMIERMTLGRDRVARGGKWIGVIPFGYDLDAAGQLIKSERGVAPLDCTEAELMADVFERVAAGSTVMAECPRLNALGVPLPPRRYPGGKEVQHAKAGWVPQSLTQSLHNPVYCGRHTLHSQYGPVERTVPAIVSPALWEQVQQQLTSNQRLSKKNAKRDYLLRGLVICENCGRAYSGACVVRPTGEKRYYRCTSDVNSHAGVPGGRCQAKRVPAQWLEDEIWKDRRYWAEHPGEAIADAQAQLRARLARAVDADTERRTLVQKQTEHAAERERVLTLYRRNRLTVAEVEALLDAIDAEAATTAGLLAVLDSQAALTAATERHLTEAATMLHALREELDDIERTQDRARM